MSLENEKSAAETAETKEESYEIPQEEQDYEPHDEMPPDEALWQVLGTPMGPLMRCSRCGQTIRSSQAHLIHDILVYKYCFNCGVKMKLYEVK